MDIARSLRTGMVSVNGTLSFAGVPSLPFGGVGDSGFGRIHGDDGLREFARPKAIAKRRMRSFVRSTTYERKPSDIKMIARVARLMNRR
jgi:succinate-semialdehyde dehydrogenase/glutarate-semialdehyde dehydrogenase